jgi:hypothetical protein
VERKKSKKDKNEDTDTRGMSKNFKAPQYKETHQTLVEKWRRKVEVKGL